MQTFFAKPTPEKMAEHIYHLVISTHETGGREVRYQIPKGLSISFVNEVIDRLGKFLLDVDVLEYDMGYIVIDWS